MLYCWSCARYTTHRPPTVMDWDRDLVIPPGFSLQPYIPWIKILDECMVWRQITNFYILMWFYRVSSFEPNLGEYVSPPYPVAYLGFHKGGIFSLATNAHTKGWQTTFSNFFPMSKKNFFDKGPNAPPKYATDPTPWFARMAWSPPQGTIWGVAIMIETAFVVILSDSKKIDVISELSRWMSCSSQMGTLGGKFKYLKMCKDFFFKNGYFRFLKFCMAYFWITWFPKAPKIAEIPLFQMNFSIWKSDSSPTIRTPFCTLILLVTKSSWNLFLIKL